MKKYIVNEAEKRIDLFNERWYMINGNPYANVTSILDEWSKGKGFNDYLKQNGEDADYIRDKAGELGSELHLLIETFLKTGKVAYNENVTVWERFCKWWDWFKTVKDSYEWDSIDIEYICHSDIEKTAGTVDWISVNLETNKLEIWDWKSGKQIYDTMYMQVSAYSHFVKEMYNLDYTPICHVVLINPELNKKWIRQYDLIEKEDIENYFKLFQSANKRHKRETPKFLSLPLEISITDL